MVEAEDPSPPATRWDRVNRLVADIERLRGPLRISVRQTEDGLGIHIPPPRKIFATAFLMLWLCGWAAGMYFAIGELMRGGIELSSLFLLIWIVPWTIGGAGVLWVILWQLSGRERLFFTAGALVREWTLLGTDHSRIVMGSDIRSVKVDGPGGDLWGMGTIKVETAGKSMRIGSGLELYEAEFVATLIRDQAEVEKLTD